MSDILFDQLRSIVLGAIGDTPRTLVQQRDLVPIEQTVDGWFCLARGGEVVHVDDAGAGRESVAPKERVTALLGSLAGRFPLATWFVPRSEGADICPRCHGTGRVPRLPADLSKRIVCRCGGLGWIPTS
jgi:hypothetical protein